MNPPCRMGITHPEHCRKRQIGNSRRTVTGKLNTMFACCIRPDVCPHWLSDQEWGAEQVNVTRVRQRWEARL